MSFTTYVHKDALTEIVAGHFLTILNTVIDEIPNGGFSRLEFYTGDTPIDGVPTAGSDLLLQWDITEYWSPWVRGELLPGWPYVTLDLMGDAAPGVSTVLQTGTIGWWRLVLGIPLGGDVEVLPLFYGDFYPDMFSTGAYLTAGMEIDMFSVMIMFYQDAEYPEDF